MGDFLSPAALKVVAVDYQQGLLDRLNEQIKGAPPCSRHPFSPVFLKEIDSHVS